MPTISINLELIESAMDNLTNNMEKSSIKNENEVGFKTPTRQIFKKIDNPPVIKKEYLEARLKRRRSVIMNLNELGNLSDADDERESPKVIRLKFPSLATNN
jgi:hypothetical protein